MIDPKPWTYDYQENYEKKYFEPREKMFFKKRYRDENRLVTF